MERVLVIRFGALGDLCLTGWFLAALGEGGPHREITLATKAGFATLAREMRGVDRVEPLAEPGNLRALWDLAGKLRAGHWDRVVDAHAVLRSHLLLLAMGRRPHTRLGKGTTDRWLRVLGRRRGPAPHLVERLAALAPGIALGPPPLPSRRAPLAHLAGHGPRRGVAIAPGARWPSKRWPDSMFADLLQILVKDGISPLTVVIGPRERAWFPRSTLARQIQEIGTVTVVANAPLPEVARCLARHRVTVTNDSGLLHLAEAVGTPVVALFGPTIREFGYAPLLACSRLLETALPCRPCSRTGARRCHRHDLACLTRLSPALVARHVREVIRGPGAAS